MLATILGLAFIFTFISIGYVRGVLRILGGFAALLMGGLLAHPLAFATQGWIRSVVPRTFQPFVGAVLSGIIVFLVAILAVELLIHRREKARKAVGRPARDPWETWSGALLGGAWGFCVVLLILTGVDMMGGVQATMGEVSAEVQRKAEEEQRVRHPLLRRDPVPSPTVTPPDSLLVWRDEVRSSLFAPVVQKVTPLDDRARGILRDLTLVTSDSDTFERFKNHPVVAKFAQNPKLLALSKDAAVQKLVRSRDYYALLDNEQVAALVQDPETYAAFQGVDMRQVLDEVMTKEPHE